MRLLRDSGAERMARVWQPAEFFQWGPAGGFVPQRWRDDQARSFQSMDMVRPEAPLLLEDDASAPGRDEPDEADLAALPPPAEAAEEAVSQPPDPGWVSQQALEEARLEAYAKGQEQGLEAMRQQMQAQIHADADRLHERLQALIAAVNELRQSPAQLFEPLKRLAVHLAEQLVLAELTQSPQAIDRLVRRCVEELDARTQPVRIALHPDDLAVLQPWLDQQSADEGSDPRASGPAAGWTLEADDTLAPGSVRASADDAVVSDLIEHRLDALARQLLLPTQRVAAQSAFRGERLAARRAEVDAVLDAQPRMADAPRQSRFAPVVEAEGAKAPEPAAVPPPQPSQEDPPS